MKAGILLCLLMGIFMVNAKVNRVRESATFRTLVADGNPPVPIQVAPQEGSIANGSRIAYGQAASPGQFPYAAFLYTSTYSCSASVIAPRAILTAAHCVSDGQSFKVSSPSQLRIRVGNPDLYKSQEYVVKSVVIPNYSSVTNYGDIAILELHTAVKVPPVTLPPSTSYTYGPIVTALGWGLMQDQKLPINLQYTDMKTLSNAQCQQAHLQYIQGPLPPDHVCFGLSADLHSTCSGDSGGPHVTSISNPVQIALVSYGPASTQCGGTGNLDVATSVIYWRDWIQNVLSLYNLKGIVAPARLNKVADRKCFTGTTIRTVTAPDAATCCDTCRSQSTCKAWTWDGSKNSCSLKSVKGGSTTSSNCISGYFNK